MVKPDFPDMPARKDALLNTRSGGPATLVDVARIAGVSPITVSRALSAPERVRPATMAKIHAAIQETGYVKNMLAGGLASNRSRLVAIILPTIAHSIFSEMIQAATDRLAASGYQVLLGLAGYQAQREEVLVETILSRRPDGIILTGAAHSENTRKRLIAAAVPVVETWDMSAAPIDMLVGFSHEDIGHAMALHLLERGYQRIGLLTMDDPRAVRRNQGIVATLAQHGRHPVATEIMAAPATFRLGRDGANRLLNSYPEIDALACSSDTLAHGALTEAHSRQWRIPQNLAVIGFGDLDFAAATLPPLTSIRIDGAAIGTLAADAILNRLETNTHSKIALKASSRVRQQSVITRLGNPTPDELLDGSATERVIDTGFTLVVRDST